MKKVNFLILVFMILAGCEEIFIEKSLPNTPTSNFDFLWKELNEKYSFFDLKKVNWDSVYDVYRPQVNDQMSREDLFNVMSDMLNTLRDGHVNLVSEFNVSKYEKWFLDYPANLSRELILYNYLGENYKITGPLLHKELKGVGYVRYNSFQATISQENLDFIFNEYSNAKGIILDLRGNEGGNPDNSFKILSRIVTERKMIYRHAFKSGPGPAEFEQFLDVYLEPDAKNFRYEKRLVILINRQCYSATNYFTAMCKVYGIQLIGDQTGGGGGVPAGSELPNGFHANYSSSICLLPDGYNIELGIAPDIKVDMKVEDLNNGIDTIIETALLSF